MPDAMISRRRLLQGLATAAALPALPRLAFATIPGEARFVVVLLRGGVDGLAMVPPVGDRDYATTREALAFAGPNEAGGALALDGLFALHPSLGAVQELYAAGEAAVIHAVGISFATRSHFDAQAVLENGTNRPTGVRDGWLNRALVPLADDPDRRVGLSLGHGLPLLLQGARPVATWAPSPLPTPSTDLLQRIVGTWGDDPALGPIAEAALLGDMAGEPEMEGREAARRGRGFGYFSLYAETAGRMLAATDGPRVAVLDFDGFDTHAGQGTTDGRLARLLSAVGAAMSTLKRELGPAWQRTVVIVATEFGRTVAPNGTGGTDHGTAGAALILGGAVNGGRVHGRWPGLTGAALFEGRDLKTTTDVRAIFKSALRDHLRLPEAAIEDDIFPGSRDVPPLSGLIRA